MRSTNETFIAEPCRPLLKWPGGKRAELPFIKPLIPPHRRYFEPFFGGGSVFFDAISVRAYANDLHPDLMAFYHCVKTQRGDFFDLLYNAIAEWEQCSLECREAMYYMCRERYNADKLPTMQRVADFFLLRELAYGGMFRVNSDGHFNVPFGHAYGKTKNLRAKADHLRSSEVATKLQLLEVSSLDFMDFVANFKSDKYDFMFVDPPYDSAFSKYNDIDFDESDQRRLADCLENYAGKFMLVCKRTPLVESLYFDNGYTIREYEYKYKFNIKGRFSRSSTHIMVTNYATDF